MQLKTKIIFDSHNSYPTGSVTFDVGKDRITISIEDRRVDIDSSVIDVLLSMKEVEDKKPEDE